MKLRVREQYLPVTATFIVCGLLYAVAVWKYQTAFLSPQVFFDLFAGNAPLGITAVGMTFVILSGGIDLSVASVMALATMLVGVCTEWAHLNPAVAIGAALASGAAIGWLNGALIRFFELPPFLVTLGTLFLARGICFRISMTPISLQTPFFQTFGEAGIRSGDVVMRSGMLVLLAVVLVGTIIARATRFGRNIYALGGNELAARLMGVPVGRTKLWVYIFSGACAALAGVMSIATIPSGDPTKYMGLELDAIAGVVIGGTLLSGGVGYVIGTLLGVLILGIIQELITFSSQDESWTQITTGLLLFSFIALQKLLTRLRIRQPAAGAPA